MAYAVELFFDAATEAFIRRLWNALADAKTSPYPGDHYRPHVSLGGCRDLRDADALLHALETLATHQVGSLPVTFAHIGLFPGEEGVILYGVTVTTPLLLLHRRFHALFTPQAMYRSPFYDPGVWVPHCTLAHGLPSEHLPDAIALLQKQVPPSLSGLLTSVALVEIPSGEERGVFAFESSDMPE